jgi:hypothetical protein
MENTSQSMALEDVEVDLDDDTLTVIPTPGIVEYGNTVSLAIGKTGAGARVEDGDGTRVGVGAGVRAEDGSVMSEKRQFQKKERQKSSKVWIDFVSIKIGGVKKS